MAWRGRAWYGKVWLFNYMEREREMKKAINEPTNGGEEVIEASNPYIVHVTAQGCSDLLFHRWNAEAVETKAKAAKNSVAKKTDNIESYVWRNEEDELCIPGEYFRQSLILASKFKQDPRSPRKSAMDLTKAGVVSLTNLASLGTKVWDYEDKRRVVVQRAGVNRVRPAMRIGWKVSFDLMVLVPEYIDQHWLLDTLSTSGRLIGVGDFRPTFGRYNITNFEVAQQ